MVFHMQKKEVRRELKETAENFSQDYIAAASLAVCEQVLKSNEFLQAGLIFGYLAFRNEISVDLILQEALRMGKIVAVPRIISKTEMEAARLQTLQDLPLDRYGIRTVSGPAEVISPGRFDLILVPGAGFTVTGCRMGRGAGYYDRFLTETRGFTLGVSCDRLIREQIPVDQYDRKVEGLVTETRFIRCINTSE